MHSNFVPGPGKPVQNYHIHYQVPGTRYAFFPRLPLDSRYFLPVITSVLLVIAIATMTENLSLDYLYQSRLVATYHSIHNSSRRLATNQLSKIVLYFTLSRPKATQPPFWPAPPNFADSVPSPICHRHKP